MNAALPRLEDETLRLGLLMEAAQAQQDLARTALDRLRQHAAGLDEIVRDAIRTTLIEELRALGEDSERAAEALRRLARTANLRLVVWSVAVVSAAAVIPATVTWFLLPTRAEVQALDARRDVLAASLASLTRQGGAAELRRCGAQQRLCVRVERSAPRYGEHGDFLVIKGY